jgi:N-acetylneuraminic acid mutarotase
MEQIAKAGLLLVVVIVTAFIKKQDTGRGHWQVLQTKNGAAGRSECGMAACNGKLYLLGGDGNAPAEVFDPVSLTWTKKAAAPVDMNHFQPVSYQNKIYVLAAFSGGGFPDQDNLKNVFIYDTDKDSWTIGGSLPLERSRASAGAALYKGKLYLAAGIQHGHSSGTTNMFDVYDPLTSKWTALPDAPHIRDHCAAAVIKDKLYIAGGRNTSYHEPDNFMAFFSKTELAVDCYDFKTGQWSTLDAKMPLGTGGGSMVNLNDKLYYMGGERATATEQNQPRKNVYWLDPSTGNGWTATEDLQEARNGMSAAVLKDHIYVFGGAGGPAPNGRPGAPPPPMPGQPNDSLRRPPAPNREQGPRPPSPLEVFSLQ